MATTAAADYLSTFTVRVGVRRVFIDAASVNWIEADGDYAVLHVGDKTHLVREPLQRLALRLNPAQFVRVHRSTIVRLAEVSELRPLTNQDAMLRLRDGTPVRASRTYVKHLLQALSDAA
jgi:two-component system LytT family response regulator